MLMAVIVILKHLEFQCWFKDFGLHLHPLDQRLTSPLRCIRNSAAWLRPYKSHRTLLYLKRVGSNTTSPQPTPVARLSTRKAHPESPVILIWKAAPNLRENSWKPGLINMHYLLIRPLIPYLDEAHCSTGGALGLGIIDLLEG